YLVLSLSSLCVESQQIILVYFVRPAWVLELYPEAVLCSPEQQHKFLASFFTCSSHHANQRANIDYFAPEQAHRHKADGQHPQSFRCPVGQSEEIIHLELRGDATNMKIWLQKLLIQNPVGLLKPSEVLSDNLLFLETRDFTTAELLLLHLLSKLRGFVTKLNRDSMRLNLAYSKETLGCSEANCPALLYYPEAILAGYFEGLLRAGQPHDQISRWLLPTFQLAL
uniref:Uncharacterized protein n=1 Tax=Oncorhynchus kisutch TaxID=8019 RepID=A0A8C7I250_ONCKI